MRLKHFELQPPEGAMISATVVSTEGIWHLYNLISVGDTVRTRTYRKVTKELAAGGAAVSQKKIFTLSILVTSPVEYDPSGILRISGQNQSQCDDVPLQSYHTLEIAYDPPQDFKLFKHEWNDVLAMRLKEACTDESRSDVAALLLQNGLGQICFINGSMFTTRAKVEVPIPKKRKGSSTGRDDTILKFFQQMLDCVLSNIALENIKILLVCSPGHVRDEFLSFVASEAAKADAPAALKAFFAERAKIVSVRVSSGHRAALQEALVDPMVQQRMQSARVASDVAVFGDFEAMMTRDPHRCVYGTEGVFAALQDQQIDTLLLSDDLLRSHDPVARHFFTEIAQESGEYGGRIQIFSSIGVAGDSLRALGGVAAILRAPMPHLEDIEADERFLQSAVVKNYIAGRKEEALASASGSTGMYRSTSA